MMPNRVSYPTSESPSTHNISHSAEPFHYQGANYQLHYDPQQGHIILRGNLRLKGAQAYRELREKLEQAGSAHQDLYLDLRGLTFLNSSGINMLAKFVIFIRERKDKMLTIYGNSKHPWQRCSLFNLQRLMPHLQLCIEDREDREDREDSDNQLALSTSPNINTSSQ